MGGLLCFFWFTGERLVALQKNNGYDANELKFTGRHHIVLSCLSNGWSKRACNGFSSVPQRTKPLQLKFPLLKMKME